MFTNTQIIDTLAQIMNDAAFATRNQTSFAMTLTDAQNYLVERLECLRKIDSSITLVAGTSEYNLPDDWVKFPLEDSDIEDGVVSIGTNAKFALVSSSTPLLNSTQAGWRAAANGTPEKFYILREAVPKIGITPAPSATFISTYGAVMSLDYIYRPADIAYDSNSPFNSSRALVGLHYLAKLHSLWQMKLEDKQFADADRFEKKLNERIEQHLDILGSTVPVHGQHGFRTDFGGSV